MQRCSKRLEHISFGSIFEISLRAEEMEKQGKHLIHMEIGRPDFDSPDMAKDKVKEALDKGLVHYTAMKGIDELREAICRKEERRFGLVYDSDREITVTAGASEAILAVMLAMLDPGDELIVPSPYFSAYAEQACIAGCRLVNFPLQGENNWAFDMDALEAKVTEKTKALLINSPNNPAGYVIGREDLQAIGRIAEKHDLLIISDECYDEFNYTGKHLSIATLPDMRERTIVIKTASKSYAMTGWRLGYAMGPAPLIKYVNKVHQNMSTCCTSFAQYGAVAAFDEGDGFIEAMAAEFRRRGAVFYQALSCMQGIKVSEPQGAFYLYPDISAFGMNDKDFASYLLEEGGIVSVPGSFFGSAGGRYVRFAYCRSMEEIREGAERIRKALSRL